MFGFFKRLSLLRSHRHGWRRGAVATAVCGACLAGGVALAHPPGPGGEGPFGGRGRMMQEHAGVWLDGLLAEIGANDKQKAVAHAARDEVMAAMDRKHASGKGDMDVALKLFAADAIDEKALADLRQHFQSKRADIQQVVLAGVVKIHDQLDATQRQKLVAALKDFRPEARGGGFRAAIGKRMMAGRLEQMLDRVKADDAQRATIHATADRVHAALDAQIATHQALFDEALGLLAQAKIDPVALKQLAAREEAQRVAMGDVFVQAARDVHAALRPDQRAAVVKGFSEHMGHFRGQ